MIPNPERHDLSMRNHVIFRLAGCSGPENSRKFAGMSRFVFRVQENERPLTFAGIRGYSGGPRPALRVARCSEPVNLDVTHGISMADKQPENERQIDQYQLVNVIATGGISQVWEVRHLATQQPYAMKLLCRRRSRTRSSGPRSRPRPTPPSCSSIPASSACWTSTSAGTTPTS